MSLWVFGPLSNEGHQLIMPAWYPFDIQKSPNYELTYIYQAICFTYLTTANVNVDTITYALFMYICTQCDILCDDLSNLSGKQEDFNEKFIKCVQHHKTILSFAKKTNSLFNMIILGQFATSTMALALTMFQLSLVDTFDAAAVVGVFYIVGLSMQLFLYCWFGNEVETKSSHIPYAVYSSQWVDVSLKVKNNLLILGGRCQRPLKITAINLFDLSLNTFVTILRSAWSYFAVLHSVNTQ
ncbi:odorant receptor 4-like [Zophobas morio]|uniref:odorant receptor 4-like n=1 Tax=Zophobas morio TaxID=2755281 RepID=UPI0030834DB5